MSAPKKKLAQHVVCAILNIKTLTLLTNKQRRQAKGAETCTQSKLNFNFAAQQNHHIHEWCHECQWATQFDGKLEGQHFRHWKSGKRQQRRSFEQKGKMKNNVESFVQTDCILKLQAKEKIPKFKEEKLAIAVWSSTNNLAEASMVPMTAEILSDSFWSEPIRSISLAIRTANANSNTRPTESANKMS